MPGHPVTITTNDDGTVDVLVRLDSIDAAVDVATRIMADRLPGARPFRGPTDATVKDLGERTASGRKKAPKWTCPRCGQEVFVQGRISHERRHEREDAEGKGSK